MAKRCWEVVLGARTLCAERIRMRTCLSCPVPPGRRRQLCLLLVGRHSVEPWLLLVGRVCCKSELWKRRIAWMCRYFHCPFSFWFSPQGWRGLHGVSPHIERLTAAIRARNLEVVTTDEFNANIFLCTTARSSFGFLLSCRACFLNLFRFVRGMQSQPLSYGG